MNSFPGGSNNCSSIPSKARRKVASKSKSAPTIPTCTSLKLFLNYSGISKTLQKMRLHFLSRRLGFQVVVSALLLLEWIPHTQGTPTPAPVVTPNSNDQGVYSLFPNEDLRTGRSNLRREDELRPLGVRNYPLEPYRDRDGRNTRFRDDSPVNFRRISNSAVTRPIEKYNQILFDDERLNYPARRDRDRFRDFRGSRYLDREPPVSYFNSYRDRDSPYDRHRFRPGVASYLPQGSPRYFQRLNPLIVEQKYPPRPIDPDDSSKARIHVFDPASRSFGENKPQNLPNVKPGRLLIPGYNSGSAEEPGPNVFLNHEEYLDFHTKKALAALDANEKKKKDGDGESESEKRMRAKHLLFSPNIGGLRPPVPNSSEENSSGNENGSSEDSANDKGKPEIKTQKIKGVVVKALAEPTKDDNKSGQNGQETGDKNGQKQQPSEPQRLRGVPRSTTSPQDAQPTKGVKLQLGPEVTTQTTAGGIIQNSSPFPGNFISTITPTQNTFFSAVDHSGFTPVTETINFTPNTFPDLDSQNHALLGPSFRGETDSPPLIFLESQDGRSSKTGNSVDNKGKSVNNGNMILVRRVKPQTLVKSSNGSESSKSGVKNSGKDVESSMKVHKSQADSFESSNDFNLQAESMSSTGVVSKVHAHISTCPKLHGAAEVICDVHIRKRHGTPNPHLIVGWKRKFHNATQPDIVLALNKTLAYAEEDFHDKFNVTLAPGISPMLRSVLLIRNVAPPDTGNYQCEVFDGENRLKSDTLLFLCH